MKVWRLGSCEKLVGKREELVFDAFRGRRKQFETGVKNSAKSAKNFFKCAPTFL